MWRHDDELATMLRNSAESFARDNDSLARLRKLRSEGSGFEARTWTQMADLGWTGILLSERDGGSGFGLAPALTLAEVFGQYLLPEPFITSAIMAATILDRSEGDTARALASNLATGQAVATLAFQEALGQNGARAPLAMLTRVGGTLRLSGRKILVPGWSKNCWLLVTSRLDGEFAVIAVPPAQIGGAVAPRRMTDGSLTSDITFDGIELAADALLLTGEEALAATELAIARGKLALCAQLEGLSRALLVMTIDYVNQRVQFGKPLAAFQALRHKLVETYCLIELAGASWRAAASKLEDALDAETQFHVSAAKARCSDVAGAASRVAIQYHGAFGYTEEADIGLFVNAALRWSSWLGNAAQSRLAALLQHRKMQDCDHD
jgi:alkylation response protein AidB-like acyl-CoA dehydrogenase